MPKISEPLYGTLPKYCGPVELDLHEMMFWLYLPVKLPGQVTCTVPDNLHTLMPLLAAVYSHTSKDQWLSSFVYLTVKVMPVTPGCSFNRPGWHCDGFLSDDINFVWYDSIPTEFFCDGTRHYFTEDHDLSLEEMENLCIGKTPITYAPKTLLKLDQFVLHRTGECERAGVRAFVKVSLSKDLYRLKGNSVNHKLAPDWKYLDRKYTRNHPSEGAN